MFKPGFVITAIPLQWSYLSQSISRLSPRPLRPADSRGVNYQRTTR